MNAMLLVIKNMNWNNISTIQNVVDASFQKPCFIFKHSNRCGISFSAKDEMEKLSALDAVFYMVDVVAERPLSHQIAAFFSVKHESPQVLILHQGKLMHHASHSAIRSTKIETIFSQL